MRDQTVGPADALSLALAEPDRHVRRRWILGLTLASLGMWMATQTPLQVMLALQLQDITPRHKIVALGVVTGSGPSPPPWPPRSWGRCPTAPRTAGGRAGSAAGGTGGRSSWSCSPRPAWWCWACRGRGS